jgi:hypothetical protein
MPPAAAAILPHPPLIVPELAGGAALELDPLRAACRKALEAVIAASGTMILIGHGPVWAIPGPAAAGSFRPYGADVQATLPTLVDLDLSGLPAPVRLAELPLSLAVAAHLLSDLELAPAGLFAATVPATLGSGAAAAIGRTLTAAASGPGAGAERPVGLLVMGDLSACRTERAPGGFRGQAAAFDASVGEAFRTGQPARLLGLDPNQAADLMVAGRVPLQVLAGALEGAPAMRGQVLYEDAPYGVGYLVALLSGS